jgi:hypothetical protein
VAVVRRVARRPYNAGECGAGDGYYAQYSAALASAQHYAATVLVPVLLLGRFGLANSSQLSPFGRWATSKGVVVFPVARLDFQDDLVRALPHTTGNDHLMGPYLRLHIVSIMRDHPELLLSQRPNICADHVLYTDSDVLFSCTQCTQMTCCMSSTLGLLACLRTRLQRQRLCCMVQSLTGMQDHRRTQA